MRNLFLFALFLFVFFLGTNFSFGACNWVSQSYFLEVFNHGSCSVSFAQGCGNDFSATAGTSCNEGCSNISVSITGKMTSYPYYCSALRVNNSLCNYSSGYDRIDYSVLRCSTKLEADSAFCDLQNGTWNGTECNIRKTFGCETITGAGGSKWSQIDSMGTKKGTFVGSCAENGYCSSGETSCSYDSVACQYNGKNGAQCFYQCSDGNALKCNSSPSQSVSGAGTPQVYCPSKPDSSCSPNSYKEFTTPSYSAGGYGDSTADSIPVGQSPYGGADYGLILQAIHDTLHTANNLYRSQNFYQWEMDSILNYWGYNYMPEFLDNQDELITTIQNQNLSVEIPKDSVKDKRDSVYQDSSLSLLDKIKNIPERINFIADSIYQDCLASQANCKRSMIGATMEALRFLNPIADAVDIIKLIVSDDESPADSLLPSAPSDTFNYSLPFLPYDTNDVSIDTSIADSNRDAFFKFLDTIPNLLKNVDSVKNEIDSAKKVIEKSQDSSNSIVNVDSLGKSFSEIKNDTKYSFLWLSESCGSCYRINFTLTPDFMVPDKIIFNLDLGNFWGINLCTIVKEIVLLIGFVIVLLITIKSFKSAWEGGK